MVIITGGLNRIRDLIGTDLEKGQLGTDGTATNTDNTDLGAADANTIEDVTISKSDKQITVTYVLPSTDGTTTTYKEFKTYRNTAPTTNYDRIVFTGFSFTTGGTKFVTITKRYYVRNG